MRPKRRVTNFPVRWQPYAELTAAAAVACGGDGSLHTSLLGGGAGRRDGIVERNLLSQFKGEANQQQVTNDRAEPSLALSLRVGSQEETRHSLPQNRLRFRYAPTRHSPSLLPARSSVPPQTYAPLGSSPSPAGAGAGLVPQQLRSNSVQLPPGATLPEPRCGACSLHYDRLAADLLKRVNDELDRRVGLLRQELSAEVRKEVLRLHATAAAAASAAGLPQPQPCGGGVWCPGCGARPGTVVLKPYEHLCLCGPCSHDASRVCLVCSFTWTGPVETASRGRGWGRGRAGL